MAARFYGGIQMKRLLQPEALAVLCCVFLSMSATAMTVFDPSNLRQNIKQYVQMVRQVKAEYEQVAHMATAIERAEQQVQAITGPRGLGSLLNGREYRLIRRHLPYDTRRVLDDFRRGRLPRDKKGLAEGLEALMAVYDVFQDYNALSAAQLEEQRKTVRAEALSSNAVGQVMAEESLRLAATHNVENLEELLSELDASPDMKHTLDLIARMSVENSLILNQLLAVQAAEAARGARNDLGSQKQEDLDRLDSSLESLLVEDFKWPN